MHNDIEYQICCNSAGASPHAPFQQERDFYSLIADGDVEAILQLRRKFGGRKTDSPEDNGKGKLSDNPLRNEIYHLVANCTMITRYCISAGMPQEEAYNLNDLFIRRADRCITVTEVHGVNDEMALEFASRMKKLHMGAPASYAVRKAMNYICDNLHSHLTAEDIARQAGYNRSHLAVIFKRETGVSISDYIIQKRIEAAKTLMITDTPLSEVADMLGFSSQSHFCKRFRELTGMSPKEYRQRKSGTFF